MIPWKRENPISERNGRRIRSESKSMIDASSRGDEYLNATPRRVNARGRRPWRGWRRNVRRLISILTWTQRDPAYRAMEPSACQGKRESNTTPVDPQRGYAVGPICKLLFPRLVGPAINVDASPGRAGRVSSDGNCEIAATARQNR